MYHTFFRLISIFSFLFQSVFQPGKRLQNNFEYKIEFDTFKNRYYYVSYRTFLGLTSVFYYVLASFSAGWRLQSNLDCKIENNACESTYDYMSDIFWLTFQYFFWLFSIKKNIIWYFIFISREQRKFILEHALLLNKLLLS